jgi:hypothetical protein
VIRAKILRQFVQDDRHRTGGLLDLH